MSGGQRLHTRYFQVGGVFEDLPPGFEQKCREFIARMPSRVDQYESLLDRNEILLHRLKHTGIVSRERRHELATSMEALIHHFKLVTEGFRVPPGEVYQAIESPRGEIGCFVLADGSAKPARVHIRDPSFVNLQALKPMGEGGLIADLIAAIAMLDPILGGVDR